MDLFLFDYTTFDEGYQHHGLVPLREHIVWFCVGVRGGPAKGLGCIKGVYGCKCLLTRDSRIQLLLKSHQTSA
jgi:hypothetical protein